MKVINLINKLSYLLTCVDHFSKYAWAVPVRNKEAITIKNSIEQVYIQGYPEILQSDNIREFFNRILNAYFISINVKHILGSSYYSQSQGAI